MPELVEFNSSGVAVFSGTRLPVATVTASLDAGISFERLQHSWPFLTLALVEAGRVFVAEHGSAVPPRIQDVFPEARVLSKSVRPPR